MSHDPGFKDENYQYLPNDVNKEIYRLGEISRNWYKNRLSIRNKYKVLFDLLLSISETIDTIERIVNKRDK